MKKELSDKGLRKAMQEPMPYRLPSNFTFRTMQKVEEAVRRKERKQERWMWIALVAASVCLLAGGAITLHIYWGEEVMEIMESYGLAVMRTKKRGEWCSFVVVNFGC